MIGRKPAKPKEGLPVLIRKLHITSPHTGSAYDQLAAYSHREKHILPINHIELHIRERTADRDLAVILQYLRGTAHGTLRRPVAVADDSRRIDPSHLTVECLRIGLRPYDKCLHSGKSLPHLGNLYDIRHI